MIRPPRRSAVSIVVLLVALIVTACGAAPGAVPAFTLAPLPRTVPATPVPTPAPTSAPTPALAPTPMASATPPPAAFPLSLTDDEGTAVVLGSRPQRIVSLSPASTETLFAAGAGSRVVGRTDADDYPPEASAVATVVTFGKVDVEKIVGLRADLVVAGGNGLTPPDVIAKLRSLGIPVVVVYAPDVPGVLRDIELVATAAGETDAGTRITMALARRLDEITAAVATASARPRVFYEIDATKEIYGPADRSFVASMITMAGGVPITTGSATAWSIPLEKLIAADPQVIVLGDAAYGTTPAQVAVRPGWKGMTAVRTGAVRPVDDTIVTRPGPRLAEGLAALALAINPDVVLPPPGAGS